MSMRQAYNIRLKGTFMLNVPFARAKVPCAAQVDFFDTSGTLLSMATFIGNFIPNFVV